MADIITQITNLVLQRTIRQKTPTVIFLTGVEKSDLIKNIIRSVKDGNRNEETFTSDDWKEVSDIMWNLAEIPLLVKETSDYNEIKSETEIFIKEMNHSKGLVIINLKDVQSKDFTTKENISIIVL